MEPLKMDKLLYKVLLAQDLLKFAPILARDSVTNIDHMKYVTDKELESYGLSQPAIRRFRSALSDEELRRKIEKRQKEKQKTKYVDISHLEVYNPLQPPQIQVPDNQSRVPSPHQFRNKNTASPGPIRTQLALLFADSIELMEKLGEGAFGIVQRGIWYKSETEKVDVAVKNIKELNEKVRKDIQAEVSTMAKLCHPNLIQLYGVVFDDPLLMVMEFCDGGSVLDRLRSSDKPILLATQLLNYSVQIAAGMEYLEEKSYIHRDLATRNVLLTKNEQVKICDFGLSRVVDENERYYILQGMKKVPFCWCAPESLRYRKFSSASDVWAYGVTMWEIWTYGEDPWIGYGALKVLEATERGERLRRPKNAPSDIFDLMYSCWMTKPADRPNFRKIHKTVSEIKLETLETKADYIPKTPTHVSVKRGDKFIVLEEMSPTIVHGQNVATKEYGHVLKNVLENAQPLHQIQPSEKTTPTSINLSSNNQGFKRTPPLISSPKPTISRKLGKNETSISVNGSTIHKDHGDEDISNYWRDPGRSPNSCLQNSEINSDVTADIGNKTSSAFMNSNTQMAPILPRSLSTNSARSSSTTSSGFYSLEDTMSIETSELFYLVQKEMPTADIADCRRALLKHKFNIDMAVKELKVQYLLFTMEVTDDAVCAASALDSCNWDVEQAVQLLLL